MDSVPSERWLPVVGYEGLYEVSDLGRVRSLPRQTARGILGGRVLKPQPNTGGYLMVRTSRQSKCPTRLVHRLVLEAFVGPCPDGMETLHGPGGKLDNRLVNIRWGTPVENQRDMIRDGTVPDRHGERNSRAKLTWAIVLECRRRGADGESHRALAREFGVTRSVMWRALKGESWHSAQPIQPP
jgi:hypothetical protein